MSEQTKSFIRERLNEYQELQSKVEDKDLYMSLSLEDRDSLVRKFNYAADRVARLFCQFENELLS